MGGARPLQDAARLGKKLLFYTGPNPQHKANAAVLVRTCLLAPCTWLCAPARIGPLGAKFTRGQQREGTLAP